MLRRSMPARDSAPCACSFARGASSVLMVAATLALGACAGSYQEGDGRAVSEPAAAAPTICDGVDTAPSTPWGATEEALACGAMVRWDVDAVQAMFDAPFWAARHVVGVVAACAESDVCTAADQPSRLGLALYAASTVDPMDLPATLEALDAPKTERLTTRYRSALAVLHARGAAFDETQRDAYVHLPGTVRAEIRAVVEGPDAPGDQLAALDGAARAELAALAPTDALIAELRALRRARLDACWAASTMTLGECVNGPIARQATVLLIRLEAMRGNGGAARVERDLLDLAPDCSGVLQTLAVRQRAELDAAANVVEVGAASVLPEVDADLVRVTGRVGEADSVRGRVRIEFDSLVLDPAALTCEPGAEVALYWAEQRLVSPDCDAALRGRPRHRPEPITVDADAASGLRPGQIVEAWVRVGDRTGRVARVYPRGDGTTPSEIGGLPAE